MNWDREGRERVIIGDLEIRRTSEAAMRVDAIVSDWIGIKLKMSNSDIWICC